MIRNLLAVVGFSMATSAFAVDFSAADALFQERATKAVEARAAYLQLGQTASGDEKAYAYTQVARLDYVRGEVLGASDDDKLKIYEDCFKTMDALNPAVGGMTAEAYFSGKMMCLALWAEKAGTFTRIKLVGEYKALKGAAEGVMYTTNANGDITLTSNYDGGSFGRYMSAIMGNPAAAILGVHDAKNAISVALQTTQLTGRADNAYPVEIEGKNYFENWYVYASVLRDNGQAALSKTIAKSALDAISAAENDGSIEEFGRMPEVERIKVKLQSVL